MGHMANRDSHIPFPHNKYFHHQGHRRRAGDPGWLLTEYTLPPPLRRMIVVVLMTHTQTLYINTLGPLLCRVPDIIDDQCWEPDQIRLSNVVDPFLSVSGHLTLSRLSVRFPTSTLCHCNREPDTSGEPDSPTEKSSVRANFRLPSKPP